LLTSPNGKSVGSVRLRISKGMLLSNFKKPGGSWGGDIKASKDSEETSSAAIQIRSLYLPKQVNGSSVLDEEMKNSWRATNENLEAETLGICFRSAKRLDAKLVNDMALWETLLCGQDEGDAWVRFDMPLMQVRTQRLFLPKQANGITVLVKDSTGSWKTTNAELGANTVGLSFRRSKKLDDKVDEIVKWGQSFHGSDAMKGWVECEAAFADCPFCAERGLCTPEGGFAATEGAPVVISCDCCPLQFQVKRRPDAAEEEAAAQMEASCGFRQHEQVKVYSASKAAWVDGVVDLLASCACQIEGYDIPAGALKVSTASGCKWILPHQIKDVVQKSGPRVMSAIQEEDTEEVAFCEKQKVQVYSASRDAWFDGVVEKIAASDCKLEGYDVPKGAMKLSTKAGSKWVLPHEVKKFVRKMH